MWWGSQEVLILLLVDVPGIAGAAGKLMETRGLLGREVDHLRLRGVFGKSAEREKKIEKRWERGGGGGGGKERGRERVTVQEESERQREGDRGKEDINMFY